MSCSLHMLALYLTLLTSIFLPLRASRRNTCSARRYEAVKFTIYDKGIFSMHVEKYIYSREYDGNININDVRSRERTPKYLSPRIKNKPTPRPLAYCDSFRPKPGIIQTIKRDVKFLSKLCVRYTYESAR